MRKIRTSIIALLTAVCLLAALAAPVGAAGQLAAPTGVRMSYYGGGVLHIDVTDPNDASAVSMYYCRVYKLSGTTETLAEGIISKSASMTHNGAAIGEVYRVRVNVVSANTAIADSADYTSADYTVAVSGLTIDDQTLTVPMFDADYSQQLVCGHEEGRTVFYRLVSGSLPAGLSFNTNTGTVAGTPTEVTQQAAVLTVGVRYDYSSADADTALVTIPATAANSTAVLTLSKSQTVLRFGHLLDLTTLYSCNVSGMKASYAAQVAAGTKNDYTYLNGKTLYANNGSSECTLDVTITLTKEGYTPVSGTVRVFVSDRATAALSVEMSGWTYGDTPSSPVYELQYAESETGTYTVLYKLQDSPDTAYAATVPADAGDYTVKVSFVSENYRAENTANFTIAPKSIAGAVLTLTGGGQTYDGSKKTVSPSVSLAGWDKPLTYSTADFTGTYAGSYTCAVTGTGNYTGSVSAQWQIAAAAQTLRADAARLFVMENSSVDLSGLAAGSGGGTAVFTVSGSLAADDSLEGSVLSVGAAGGLTRAIPLSYTIAAVDVNGDGTAEYAAASGAAQITVYHGDRSGKTAGLSFDTQSGAVRVQLVSGLAAGDYVIAVCYRDGKMVSCDMLALKAGQTEADLTLASLASADTIRLLVTDANMTALA